MNADHFQFLVAALEHLNDGSINWGEVAKARGISRKDNATTSFKNMMKKYGIDYVNNKFTPIADFDSTSPDLTSTPKQKKPTTPRKRKTADAAPKSEGKRSSPVKRRKLDVAGDEVVDEETSPSSE